MHPVLVSGSASGAQGGSGETGVVIEDILMQRWFNMSEE